MKIVLAKYLYKNANIILTAILLIALASFLAFITLADTSKNYVRGRHSKYCYFENNYPRQIKDLVYFDTYEECVATLK